MNRNRWPIEETDELTRLFETLDVDSSPIYKLEVSEKLIELAQTLIGQAECDCRAIDKAHAGANLNETKPKLANVLFYLDQAKSLIKEK